MSQNDPLISFHRSSAECCSSRLRAESAPRPAVSGSCVSCSGSKESILQRLVAPAVECVQKANLLSHLGGSRIQGLAVKSLYLQGCMCAVGAGGLTVWI